MTATRTPSRRSCSAAAPAAGRSSVSLSSSTTSLARARRMAAASSVLEGRRSGSACSTVAPESAHSPAMPGPCTTLTTPRGLAAGSVSS